MVLAVPIKIRYRFYFDPLGKYNKQISREKNMTLTGINESKKK